MTETRVCICGNQYEVLSTCHYSDRCETCIHRMIEQDREKNVNHNTD